MNFPDTVLCFYNYFRIQLLLQKVFELQGSCLCLLPFNDDLEVDPDTAIRLQLLQLVLVVLGQRHPGAGKTFIAGSSFISTAQS